MGLSISTPFVVDEKTTKVDIDKESKEIGICQLVDPRSPSYDFERTPIYYRTARLSLEQEEQVVINDPRSPSNEVTRTPMTSEITDQEIENQLRAQIERLKLFDTPVTSSSDINLANDNDIINPKKTILKLLEEEATSPNIIDSLCLASTPPCPKSRSTPKDSPETPISRQTETGKLLKKKTSKSSRGTRRSQQSNKLQKTVLKKTLSDQVPRSPLAERNVEMKSEKAYKKKTSKPSGLIRYRKYSNLDESFSEVFPGKENEEVEW